MKREEKETYSICALLLLVSFFAIIFLSSQHTGITGLVILEKDQKTGQYVAPESVTREDALTALMQAENDLEDMSDFNLSTLLIEDILLDAQRSFVSNNLAYLTLDIQKADDESKRAYLYSLLQVAKKTPPHAIKKMNYPEVLRLTQSIAFKKKQAYELFDTISLMEEKEERYKKNNIDTSEALALLERAKTSFREERYDEAEALVKETAAKLESASSEQQRINRLLSLSKGFFAKYWLPFIIIIIILGVITRPAVKKIRKRLAKNKLESLRAELEALNKVIRQSQEAYFKDRTITKESYEIRIAEYRRRTTEIKHTIPVLEAIVFGEKKKKKKEQKRGILKIKK